MKQTKVILLNISESSSNYQTIVRWILLNKIYNQL